MAGARAARPATRGQGGAESTDRAPAAAVSPVAEAVRGVVDQRNHWLNPEGVSEVDLKKRTLTNLYNAQPTWLDPAQGRLDEAVRDAHGWPQGIGDEEMLERLLALNLERADNSVSHSVSDPAGPTNKRSRSHRL